MLRKSDAALCAAVRDGHEAAFAAIVLRYRSQLLRHCRSLLRGDHAEDAVQQTFMRALQALRSGTEVRELGPWLHRIARNVALNELGSRERGHAELREDWEDRGRSDELDRRAELRAALIAVEALPDRQRNALVRSVSGEKPSAIAAQLDLSNVAVRQLVHRARMTVRAAVHALVPPPLIWLARRMATTCDRLPRSAGVPAGAAPVVSKIAVVVVATASVAAPATVIHAVLAHHPRHHNQRADAMHQVPHPALEPAPAAPILVAAPPSAQPILPTRVIAPARPRAHRGRPRRVRMTRASDRAPAQPQAASTPSSPAGTQTTSASAQGTSAQAPAGSSAAYAGGPMASGDAGSSSAAGPVATASASGPTGGSGGPSGP